MITKPKIYQIVERSWFFMHFFSHQSFNKVRIDFHPSTCFHLNQSVKAVLIFVKAVLIKVLRWCFRSIVLFSIDSEKYRKQIRSNIRWLLMELKKSGTIHFARNSVVAIKSGWISQMGWFSKLFRWIKFRIRTAAALAAIKLWPSRIIVFGIAFNVNKWNLGVRKFDATVIRYERLESGEG